jgi:CRISPR-associated endonuclease Cas2
MRWIASYDIAADRRRARTVSILQRWGIRTQESVFILEVENEEVIEIEIGLGTILDDRTDRFAMVPICENCWSKRVTIGPVVEQPADPWWVL